MNKFLNFKYLFFTFFSFFIFYFSVNALQQIVLDNIATYEYLNIHSLQYDDRPIAQRYYNFLKDLNFDLYSLIVREYGEDSLRSHGHIVDNNMPYFISLLGNTIINNSSTQYDLSNGINISLNIGKNLDESLLGDSANNLEFILPSPYNTEHRALKFNLKLLDNNNFILTYNGLYHIPTLITDRYSVFLGYFFQSNFYVNFDDNTAERPLYINGIRLNNNSNIYFSSTHKYLGYEYFDNNLMIGPGVPLYSANAYYTNTFEFGVPYTDDYSYTYLYSSSRCFLTPTSYLGENYDSIHSNESDSLYFKYSNSNGGDVFSQRLHFYSFYDIDYYKNLDSDSIKIEGTNSVYPESYINYNYIDISDDSLYSFSPKIFTSNSLIELRLSNRNYSEGLTIYYPKNLWNITCSYSSNDFTIIDSNGNSHTITPSTFETADDGVNLFDGLFDFISNFLNTIKDLFTLLFNNIKDFFGFVFSSLSDILVLDDAFIFVGDLVTSFYNSLPLLVRTTFNFIFIIGGILFVFKLIIG